MNCHSFNIELAKKCGVDCAIFLQDLAFWIDYNRSSDINYHDGRYWTFSTVEKLCERHPYWTKKQMRRIVEKCKENGWIITGNYNNSKYNRTTWYALNGDIAKAMGFQNVDEDTGKSICENENFHLPEKENGSSQTGKSMKDNINNIYAKDLGIIPPLPPNKDKWGLGQKLDPVFRDWIQYKYERKEPYKPKGLETLISQIKKKVDMYGEEAVIEAIQNSMANNWKGIILDRIKSKDISHGIPAKPNVDATSSEYNWMKKYIQNRKGDSPL